MPEVVNVVASGKLGAELDLKAIGEDIDAPIVTFSGESYSNSVVYIREQEDGPIVTLYRSGSYHITGTDGVRKAEEMKDWVVDRLQNLGIEVDATFDVKNVVAVGDIETDVDLNQLVLQLGFEETEYEPEDFPGLIFRPVGSPCVFLIFASGRIVAVGATAKHVAFDAFDELRQRITQLQ